MMKDDYRKQLGQIHASEAFKADTKAKLLLALEETESPAEAPAPRLWWRLPQVRRAALAACTLAIAVVGWRIWDANSALTSSSAMTTGGMERSLAQDAAPAENEAAPENTTIAEEERLPSTYFAQRQQLAYSQAADMPAGEEPVSPSPEEPDAGLPSQEEPPSSTSLMAVQLPDASPSEPEKPLLSTTSSSSLEASTPESIPVPGKKEGSEAVEQAPPEEPQDLPIAPSPSPDLVLDLEEPPADSITEEDAPASLPVFRNSVVRGDDEDPGTGFDDSALAGLIEEQAAALGLRVNSIAPAEDDRGARLLTADCGEAEIRAWADGAIGILYHEAVVLAEDGATRQAVEDPAGLVQAYSELFAGMQQPVAASVTALNPGKEQVFAVYVYDEPDEDNSGVLALEKLSGACLMLDAEGSLTQIQLWRGDMIEPLGDYPLITVDEATALLIAGEATTTLPCEFPGEESIYSVSIEYRYTGYEEFVVPYYRFYVKLDVPDALAAELDPEGNGHDLYGVWAVPALAPEYLE